MYIALKWLVTLNFLLWLGLCIANYFLNYYNNDGNNEKLAEFHCNTKSVNEQSRFLWFIGEVNVFGIMMYALQILLFGMMILVWRSGIYWQSKIKLRIVSGLKYFSYKYATIIISCLKTKIYLLKHFYKSSKEPKIFYNVVNFILLYLIIEYLMKERKKFAKPVLDLQQEKNENNKKVEIVAIKRLSNVDVEDAQKHEDQSCIKSYIELCCENAFLMSSLEKLDEEKKIIESNLFNIITQVLLSNSNDLKVYCSKFIVRTKDDLFKEDMKLEVQQFLAKSRKTTFHSDTSYNIDRLGTKSLINGLNSRCIHEYITGNQPGPRPYK